MKNYIQIILSVMAFAALSANAADQCSKKAAEEFVNKTCDELAKTDKAEDAKKGWPKSLLFANCGENYIWVQDTSPTIKMIMHPVKQKLIGTDLDKTEDENHFKLFVEFDKAAKKEAKGAWVDYLWGKPGAEKATPKTSFVKKCTLKDKTEWIIGSGVWKEDLKDEKKEEPKKK